MTTRIRLRAALLAAAALLALAAPAGATTAGSQLFPSDPPVIRG